MANTLTNLLPTIYQAIDIVSRELVGFIPSVYRNTKAERVAKDQTIRYPIVPALTAGDITPAATGPNPSGVTVGSATMSIDKSRGVEFHWEGEETVGLESGGTYDAVLRDEFAQAIRALCNEIETDIAAAAAIKASRAYGTRGTTPFGSNFNDVAEMKRILDDNGCPGSERRLVIDTAAGVKLRNNAQLTKANEAGSDAPLRRGELLDIHGFRIRESGQIALHTHGTDDQAFLINNAADEAVGQTTITVDTGTGTILAGDLLSFQADTARKYVVKTALAAGDVIIGGPGLRLLAADNSTVVNGNADHTPNVAFHQNAIHLITRLPALPRGGDAAADRTVVTDPVSGLKFEISLYRQYRRIVFQVAIAWGKSVVKEEHVAILAG